MYFKVLKKLDSISGAANESSEDVSSAKRQKVEDEEDGPSTSDLYRRLQEVDPERASEIHPNERRKIARSLEGKQ